MIVAQCQIDRLIKAKYGCVLPTCADGEQQEHSQGRQYWNKWKTHRANARMGAKTFGLKDRQVIQLLHLQ